MALVCGYGLPTHEARSRFVLPFVLSSILGTTGEGRKGWRCCSPDRAPPQLGRSAAKLRLLREEEGRATNNIATGISCRPGSSPPYQGSGSLASPGISSGCSIPEMIANYFVGALW